MALRKLRKSWWVDFRFDRVRYRRRSPENSRAGARAYELMLQHTLARGESIDKHARGQSDQSQTFGQFALRWFKEYVIPNNKYSERRTKKYTLHAHLVSFFGTIPIGKIGSHHVEQFKARQIDRGLKNKTINNQLTILRTCLTTAQEWLNLKPIPKIKWLKCPPPRTDFLSREDCDLLLSHANGMLRELILVALRTGMRQGELKALQWSSIDWNNRMLTVRHSWCDYQKTLGTPKSNRERHIPLDTEVGEILFRRSKKCGFVFTDENNQPFNNRTLNYRLAKACREAGLREITWHILRHTFASHLVTANVPLAAVQALLGHTNITTTMRYAHLSPSTLRSAIDTLNARQIGFSLGQPVGNGAHSHALPATRT